MPQSQVSMSAERSLFVEHDAPADATKPTFVFVNALTGSTEQWQEKIGPALRSNGYGTLAYNFAGQANTEFSDNDILDDKLIAADLKALVEKEAPANPLLVGLSIGGLYAARAILSGCPSIGLVLINTLRKPTAVLDWTNQAVARAASLGGTRLVVDLFLPMLAGPSFVDKMATNAFDDAPYDGFAEDNGLMRLIEASKDTDWDIPYEQLTLPVCIVTGLRDRVFRHPEQITELTNRMPDTVTYEIADHGHLLPAEAPEDVTKILKLFGSTLETA